MDDCIFCKIVNGSVPSRCIYEDENVKVFLNINPSTNGDVLLIPKKHIVTIDEVDDKLMLDMFKVIKEIKVLLEDKLNCSGLTIVENNGYGQEIKHLHFHLTPRYEDDKCDTVYNKDVLLDLDKVFNKITN